jgi:hypothetical protein
MLDAAAGHPSRVLLARHTANELSEAERRDLRRHLDSCAACRESLARMQADMDAFEARRARSLAGLRSRVEKAGRPSLFGWTRFALSAAAVAAAALVLVVVVRAGSVAEPVEPSPVAGPMYKGALGLQVYARRAAKQFRVHQGTQLTCGDELRFAVTTASPGYATVFSLDGRDRLTPFYPSSSPRRDPAPLRLSEAGRRLLPGGITLDDATGRERIVVVFAARRFDRRAVHRRAARELRRSGREKLSASSLGLSGEVVVLGIRKVRCAE